MQESIRSSVILDTEVDDPEIFDKFIQFAYFDDYHPDAPQSGLQMNLLLHGRVYVLAERLVSPALKQRALTKCVSELMDLISGTGEAKRVGLMVGELWDTVQVVYRGTYDKNSGKLLGHWEDPTKPDSGRVVRDWFRWLLAYLCSRYLDEMTKVGNFFPALVDCPEFMADVLVLTAAKWRPLILDGVVFSFGQ
ncbi:hypothetical protein ABW19_dt0204153 [Dactylella cylindrospora]|nr:hypothetical protein ABW19_dt0204153 [Dactylella cylindrospora]